MDKKFGRKPLKQQPNKNLKHKIIFKEQSSNNNTEARQKQQNHCHDTSVDYKNKNKLQHLLLNDLTTYRKINQDPTPRLPTESKDFIEYFVKKYNSSTT